MSTAYDYAGSELSLLRTARNWKRYLAAQLGPFITGDVLEVGAGIGSTTLALHKDSCASWTCLEPDRALAAELGASVARLRDRSGQAPRTVVGTLAELTPGAQYDTVLYSDVLEHIADDRGEVVRALARLRTGGQLVVMSPAHQWLYTEFDKAIGHERRYDARSLRALTVPGTELVCLRYLDCIGIAASLGNRLVMHQHTPTLAQITTWDRLMVPISRVLDPLLGHRVGKSVLAVWRKL